MHLSERLTYVKINPALNSAFDTSKQFKSSTSTEGCAAREFCACASHLLCYDVSRNPPRSLIEDMDTASPTIRINDGNLNGGSGTEYLSVHDSRPRVKAEAFLKMINSLSSHVNVEFTPVHLPHSAASESEAVTDLKTTPVSKSRSVTASDSRSCTKRKTIFFGIPLQPSASPKFSGSACTSETASYLGHALGRTPRPTTHQPSVGVMDSKNHDVVKQQDLSQGLTNHEKLSRPLNRRLAGSVGPTEGLDIGKIVRKNRSEYGPCVGCRSVAVYKPHTHG
ncbi:hypothetical protein J6590_078903 [Homalodisca vitripennis]|nr:hypothetical protein J6590_078903 [Homalodisca vitripennis]